MSSQKLILFVGAGISKNSGLPLANELKEEVLRCLTDEKDNISIAMNSDLPFEAFMEILSNKIDIAHILDIFTLGEPNSNHILIAKLAKIGIITDLITTNFDTLLESSLLKENVLTKKYLSESDFEKITFRNKSNAVNLFKIHGCVESKESIRTTLSDIANKRDLNKRLRIINHFFKSKKNDKIVILGYSCSDLFDIIPQLKKLKNPHKKVEFILHNPDQIEEEERIKRILDGFDVNIVKENTNDYMHSLWKTFEKEIGTYELFCSKTNWKHKINLWKRLLQNNEFIQYALLGDIFYKISKCHIAKNYFEQALHLARLSKNKEAIANQLGNLGRTNRRIDLLDDALECHQNALSHFININKELEHNCSLKEEEKKELILKNKKGIAIQLHDIGTLHRINKNDDLALKHHVHSLIIDLEINNKWGIAIQCGSIGAIYKRIGGKYKNRNYQDVALYYFKKSLGIDEKIGNMEGQAIQNCNIGVIFRWQRQFKKSYSFLKKSLDVYRSLGNIYGESIILREIITLCLFTKDYDLAEKSFSEINLLYDENKDLPPTNLEQSIEKIERIRKIKNYSYFERDFY